MEENLDEIFIDLWHRNNYSGINLGRMKSNLEILEKDLKNDFDSIKEKFIPIPEENKQSFTTTKIHINRGGTSEWITFDDSDKTEKDEYRNLKYIYSRHDRYIQEMKEIILDTINMIGSNTEILEVYKRESKEVMKTIKDLKKSYYILGLSLILNFFLLIEYFSN